MEQNKCNFCKKNKGICGQCGGKFYKGIYICHEEEKRKKEDKKYEYRHFCSRRCSDKWFAKNKNIEIRLCG